VELVVADLQAAVAEAGKSIHIEPIR
jgi:hypothetical protein